MGVYSPMGTSFHSNSKCIEYGSEGSQAPAAMSPFPWRRSAYAATFMAAWSSKSQNTCSYAFTNNLPATQTKCLGQKPLIHSARKRAFHLLALEESDEDNSNGVIASADDNDEANLVPPPRSYGEVLDSIDMSRERALDTSEQIRNAVESGDIQGVMELIKRAKQPGGAWYDGTPLGEKSEENDANDDSSDNDKTSETQSELSNLDFLLGTMNRNQDEDNDSS